MMLNFFRLIEKQNDAKVFLAVLPEWLAGGYAGRGDDLTGNDYFVHMLSASRIRVPIAMLHQVGNSVDETLQNWRISKQAFCMLLDTLEEKQRMTTHFAELLEKKAGRAGSGDVILSFDDCYRHLFDFAIPELVSRKMKAVFYMPTANIGGYNDWDVQKGSSRLELMNETELKELVQLGMEVGSHSHHHIELAQRTAAEVDEELNRSKELLEDITGKPVYSVAYPFGSVPAGYQSIVKKAGFYFGVCIYHPVETNLALRRFGVYEKDTPQSISHKLSGRYRMMRMIFDKVKKY